MFEINRVRLLVLFSAILCIGGVARSVEPHREWLDPESTDFWREREVASVVADLTALRRAARDRAGAAFPPTDVQLPGVPNGTLVIGEGGRLPDEVIEKFLELAGGPNSLIVVIPTAAPDPLPSQSADAKMLQRAGATNVVVLPQRKRAEVEGDDFTGTLKKARGIWFGGGRQWRFVDAYENTAAYELFHDVLRRGGVIGGSSAGASIQGEFLARGSPLGNANIVAEGYERGFNFLPGVAIDQHFTQRDRAPDLVLLTSRYPQLLGLGIDESTAIVVQDTHIVVIGGNQAHIFEPAVNTGAKRVVRSLMAGQQYQPGLFMTNVGCVEQVDTHWCVTSANRWFRRERSVRRAIRLAQRTT